MPAPLAVRLSRFLVRCYPPRWRQRYAAEVLDVLDQYQPTARTVLNLYAGAISAHLDPAWWGGRHPAINWRRCVQWTAGVVAVLLLPASCAGYGVWEEDYGGPYSISDGTEGVAFSPDQDTVAVINPGLEMWNVADRAHPKLLGYSRGDHNLAGGDPAFSPSGRILATGGWGLTLWNVANPARPAQIAVLPAGHNSGLNTVAFSPDGRTLAGRMILWDVADPAHARRIAVLTGQAGISAALAFSPDGKLLASGSANGSVFVWDVADPARARRIAALSRQAGGISAISYSPDGKLLASASDGGTVILRNVADPAVPVTTATLRFAVPVVPVTATAPGPDVALAFSANGRMLTTIASNSRVTLWDVADPGAVSRISTITSGRIGTGEVAFSPGGRIVAGPPINGDELALWMLPN